MKKVERILRTCVSSHHFFGHEIEFLVVKTFISFNTKMTKNIHEYRVFVRIVTNFVRMAQNYRNRSEYMAFANT